jgi:hypothetical protein
MQPIAERRNTFIDEGGKALEKADESADQLIPLSFCDQPDSFEGVRRSQSIHRS